MTKQCRRIQVIQPSEGIVDGVVTAGGHAAQGWGYPRQIRDEVEMAYRRCVMLTSIYPSVGLLEGITETYLKFDFQYVTVHPPSHSQRRHRHLLFHSYL